MQSGGASRRTPLGTRVADQIAMWITILTGVVAVRVAGTGFAVAGAGRGPAGVHLAASAEFVTAGRTAGRPVAGPVVDGEDIDPEVVEHVRGAQEGNAYSFSILYDRYVDKVYAYCYHRTGDRQTAEDLTSDVFMRALKRISTFTWQGKDFGAWLITIARNRCHDHFKSSRFRMEHAVAEVYDSTQVAPPSYDAQPERGLEVADIRASVHEGLAKLKPEQAEVLYHRFLQGCDTETTAKIMGKNEGAIRALQYRALKALAKHVDVEALV